MDYRRKIELKGKVRLVEYPGADLCACCGTHVAHTGEIGLMKILSVSRHKDGVRMEMLFGGRAMKDYDKGKVKTAMIMSPKDKESVNYVMGSADLNMRDVGKLLNEELHGRGGGRPEMVQGSFQAEADAVEQAFRQAVKA